MNLSSFFPPFPFAFYMPFDLDGRIVPTSTGSLDRRVAPSPGTHRPCQAELTPTGEARLELDQFFTRVIGSRS